jgi:hypothetical protein
MSLPCVTCEKSASELNLRPGPMMYMLRLWLTIVVATWRRGRYRIDLSPGYTCCPCHPSRRCALPEYVKSNICAMSGSCMRVLTVQGSQSYLSL